MLFKGKLEPDGREFISPRSRMLLSIVVTGIAGFLLEYIGIEVLKVFHNTNPNTIYFVTGIWAFGLGPLIVLFRRSHIIVPMLIVGILFAILVLYNHYHYIAFKLYNGNYIYNYMWGTRVWEFHEGAILGIKNPLLIALVAGIIEMIVVPVSVYTQKLLTLKFKKKTESTPLKDLKQLFDSSQVTIAELKPKHDFGFFLMRFIFFAYGIYFVYMTIGLFANMRELPVVGMMFINPLETINTVMKLTVMIALAAVGAFNANLRRDAAIFLAWGHMISVVGSLWLYFTYPVNPLFPAEQSYLLQTVIGDGLLVLGLLYIIMGPAYKENKINKIEDVELRSPASTLFRTFLLVFGCLFSLYTIAIIYFRAVQPDSPYTHEFAGPDPLVSNSLTKYGTVAFLCLLMYAKPRLRKYFAPVLAIAFTFGVIAVVIYAFQGNLIITTPKGETVSFKWWYTWRLFVDGSGLILLIMLRKLYYRVDFQVSAMNPGSAECVIALNNAFRTQEQEAEGVSREVLQKIDEHIVGIRGRRRGLIGFPFWMIESVFPFMCGFRPPFSTMSREEQRWMLKKYILRQNYEQERSSVPGFAEFMYQMGFIAHTLVSLSFFTTEKGHSKIGYIPPDARKRLQKEVPSDRPPIGSEPLNYPGDFKDPVGKEPLSEPSLVSGNIAPRIGSLGPSNEIPDETDYCIIGSGAAGGLIAYRLGAAKGKDNSVCVIERGGYYLPKRDFSDDEMRMSRMLYTEGGLQVSRALDFKVLQGECVGGTTVINNAVCFKMPEISKKEWETFGIPVGKLDSHYDTVAGEINIRQLTDIAVNEIAETLFKNGVSAHNRSASGMGMLTPAERNSGNFNNCIGCGLCNVACKYMRKLSVLETYIPWAQSHGVKVIPFVSGVQCETDNSQRKKVTSVIVRRSNGEFKKIKIKKALIVSAGAIASSRFLMRSKIGGEYVGRQISCNFAVPPLAVFDKNVNAFDGLQMTMYAFPETHEAVFETTFNTPGTYSIALQTYFEKHADLMKQYTNSVNFTALVGSDPGGTVSIKRDILFGRALDWVQTKDDLNRIKKAIVTIINISKGAGAKKIYLPTHPVLEVPLDNNVDSFVKDFSEKLNDKKYFDFVTAHPQGGNMMAGDSIEERVVDLDFRVRDCENLFVCDASIFPRGVRVNPQWSIMAAASLASEKIISTT